VYNISRESVPSADGVCRCSRDGGYGWKLTVTTKTRLLPLPPSRPPLIIITTTNIQTLLTSNPLVSPNLSPRRRHPPLISPPLSPLLLPHQHLPLLAVSPNVPRLLPTTRTTPRPLLHPINEPVLTPRAQLLFPLPIPSTTTPLPLPRPLPQFNLHHLRLAPFLLQTPKPLAPPPRSSPLRLPLAVQQPPVEPLPVHGRKCTQNALSSSATGDEVDTPSVHSKATPTASCVCRCWRVRSSVRRSDRQRVAIGRARAGRRRRRVRVS
jgi:hypothetical protein